MAAGVSTAGARRHQLADRTGWQHGVTISPRCTRKGESGPNRGILPPPPPPPPGPGGGRPAPPPRPDARNGQGGPPVKARARLLLLVAVLAAIAIAVVPSAHPQTVTTLSGALP